jgi:hypothetical protein
MLEGLYKAVMNTQARKAIYNVIARPDMSLAIGAGERLEPIAINQYRPPQQSRAVVRPMQNRDQMDNIKALLPVSSTDFVYEGGYME